MRPVFAIFCLALVAGCGGDRLERDLGSVQASTTQLVFPRTFIGYPTTRTLELVNSAKGSRRVSISTRAPFSADTRVEVPPLATVQVEVRFNPKGAGAAAGALHLSSDGASVEVQLSGSADAPVDCGPSPTCAPKSFDPDSGTCVTGPAPDGTACADDACLENGHCEAGACVGTPRDCGDGNACTADACDPVLGCVHQDESASCPAPSDPCHVAFCDPSGGCGIESAPDGTVCGSVDCQTAHVCMLGSCRAITPPNGYECAPASPCQAHGTCQGGQCVQPAASTLQPEWTYALPADGGSQWFIQGVMADAQDNLYLSLGPTSGFPDAGAPNTRVMSFTPNGFERLEVDLPDGWGLLGVEGDRLLVQSGGAILGLSVADGGVLFDIDGGYATSIAVAGDVALSHYFDYGMEVERNGDAVAFSIEDGGELWRLAGYRSGSCQCGPWACSCSDPANLSPPVSDGTRFFLTRMPFADAGGPQGLVAYGRDGALAWQDATFPPFIDPYSGQLVASGSDLIATSGEEYDASTGQQLSPLSRPPWPFYILAADDRVLWDRTTTEFPDGGWAQVIETRATPTGSLIGTAVSSPFDAQLTTRGTALVEEDLGLSEFAPDAQRLWSCPIPTGRAWFDGFHWGWGTLGLLTHGHYLRVSQAYANGAPPLRYLVESYSLPGIDLADHGWVTFGGNPGRTNHPR